MAEPNKLQGNKSRVANLKFMQKNEKAEDKQKQKQPTKVIQTSSSFPAFFSQIQTFVDKMPETTEATIHRNAVDPSLDQDIGEPPKFKY